MWLFDFIKVIVIHQTPFEASYIRFENLIAGVMCQNIEVFEGKIY